MLSLEAVGYADIAAKKPMRADALFWIASQSKPITAAALMMLVDEGKVRLDDPVEKYLPEFKGQMAAVEQDRDTRCSRSRSAPVTVRDICSATPAACRSSRPSEEPTLDLPAAARRRAQLRHDAARSSSRAASTSIPTPASTPRAASSKSSAACPTRSSWTKRLFEPLGMKDTTFWPSEEQLERLAKSYKPNADKTGLEETTITQLKYPLDDRQAPADARRRPVLDGQRRGAVLPDGAGTAASSTGKRYLSEAAVKRDDEQADRRRPSRRATASAGPPAATPSATAAPTRRT